MATYASNVFLNNILVRILSFFVLILLARSAYLLTFNNQSLQTPSSSTPVLDSDHLRSYYSSVFQDLIAQGVLSTYSHSLFIEPFPGDDEIGALRELGVQNSIAISSKKLTSVSSGKLKNLTFDFMFTSVSGLDRTLGPVLFASEVSRKLRTGGFFVVHTKSGKDKYSLHSLLRLFNALKFVRLREIEGLDSSVVREVIFRKVNKNEKSRSSNRKPGNTCSVSKYQRDLIRNLEPLIEDEPTKPWTTWRSNNVGNDVNYLSEMVDISFKNRYIYIDVGSRSYGSSIGSWFNKHYPKQDKSFQIYAIEADRKFHDGYKTRKHVTLLPYVAWIRNETLFFEMNHEPSRENEEKGRGSGKIRNVQSSSYFMGDWNKIRGFDFAMWLRSVAVESDYVVVKMDVGGTEFDLITRLIESGGICLIDEMFIECHYNGWRGRRKYRKTYAQCLELFSSLRKSGFLVHQYWW